MADEALGLLETRGLVAAIEACDAMLKAARVELLRRQVTSPALVTICITGETAAVRSALDAGCRAAEKVGLLLSAHLIPRPAEGIVAMTAELQHESWSPRGGKSLEPVSGMTKAAADRRPVSPGELAVLPVRQMRALARSLQEFPLSGRQISLARRDELLALLRTALFNNS